MNDKVKSWIFGYGLAVVSTVVATWLRDALHPYLGERVPFVTYFPAVFATAIYARVGPALLAVALSSIAASHWFITPTNSLLPGNVAEATGLGLFIFSAVAVSLLSEQIHRQADQVLQARNRFSITLAGIADAVIVTDEQGRISYLNRVAERLTGWVDGEARNESFEIVFRIVNEQTRQPSKNPVTRALRERRVVGLEDHTILIAKDGTEHAIDQSAAPICEHDGQVVGVVVVFRDVSQQRSVEFERGRLAALVDSSEDAIFGQSFEGVVTSWNAGAERLFGYAAEEIVGCSVFATIVPDEKKDELQQVLRRIERGERVDEFETIRQCKDGRRLPIAVRISPIFDAEGKVIGASAIDRDISQQRRAERRRNARLAVTQILAQEKDVNKAITDILVAVCDALQWTVGCFWQVDPSEQVLRCHEFWQDAETDYQEFQAATKTTAFARGAPLPGRVWETGQSEWIADVVTEPEFLRASEAASSGLHGGFACPVAVDDEFLGVIEFFSPDIQQPDGDLLEMMATIGGQIGQFIERRQAERLLRRSEEELADFFENAAVGLHWVGPDGTILRANRTELELLGYTREEYVGRHIAEFHADQPVIEDILECLKSGRQLRDYEARLRCKDGTIKYVLIDSNVFWEDGQFVHSRCFTRDITERKTAEASLRRAQERLALALEAGRMGSWEWHIPTAKVIWSPTLEKIHGLEAGEFSGTFEAYQQDIHPDDREYVLETIRQTVELKREHHLEYRIIRPDGSVRWLQAQGTLFYDEGGQPVRVVGVCSDVTERKRMEQALRFLSEASKSLASLIDYKNTLQRVASLAVPDFADWCTVDMVNSEGLLERMTIAHVDPTQVALAEELYRRYPSDPNAPQGAHHVFRTGHSELTPEITDSMLQQAAQDEEHLRILRELKLHSYMCVPIKAKQTTLGVITFVSGESGRVYGADDLAMAEELSHRAAIAIENARLYQQVREADRRKDEFLAMLAHELRNPLAPIRSGLEILAMTPGQESETIGLMQEQVEHMVRLVDDLLDVSRIMRGKVELRHEPVELATVVRRSVAAVRPRIESHCQQLDISLPEEPIWLDADPVRVVQILENLLNNASKYMDDGGLIELTTERRDQQIVICVRDTGIGIDNELLPNVFELFTQSTRSLDRAQGGLGIGLTLVQRLVQLHGGTVSAFSDGEGQGSTFTVCLPTARAPLPTEPPEAAPLARQPRRIVVVDDNVSAAWLLSKLLKKLGDHDVVVAHDGPSALTAIEQNNPEIVLLDIGLPGMDGFEVGRRIRDDAAFDNLLLVALTGYGQEEDRQKSREAGFDVHLVKPPALDQLHAVLGHPKLA
ncbi:MAG: PAS domain S-box protein [Planctomycetaceae bacterium]|nr:PAS domain S-box protein [Planctomycetales bacterium]MCB9940627.1 PAS domain S-box protein [Planctomycetaceae bacterium]